MSEHFGRKDSAFSFGAQTARHCLLFLKRNWRTLALLGALAALAAVYPLLERSDYKSSTDFHAAVETLGAVIALIAALALLVQFITFGTRLHLFIGLAFITNAALDLFYGLLVFGKAHTDIALFNVPVEQLCVPAYAVGRMMFGIVFIASLWADKYACKSLNQKKETAWSAILAFTLTAFVAAAFLKIPLPEILPTRFAISRPADYTSALILAVAFLLFFQKYSRQKDIFIWWILLSLGIAAVGQVVMSFSKNLSDPFFDVSLIYKVLGYAAPLLGFFVCRIVLINQRKQIADELQKANIQLQIKTCRNNEQLLEKNVRLTGENLKHKQAQRELKKLKKQLEFILGATGTGLDIIDSDLNVKFIDPQRQKIYGSPDGKKCCQYFLGRDKPCEECGVLKALESKTPVVSERIFSRENDRPVQVTSIPFRNENNQWMVAEINIDLSERKKLEQKLQNHCAYLEDRLNEQTARVTAVNKRLDDEVRQQKLLESELSQNMELLNTILDSANDGIVVIDKNYRCVHCNYAMEKLFRLNRLRLLESKTDFRQILPNGNAAHIRKALTKAMNGQILNIDRTPYLLTDGSRILVQETFVPVNSTDEKVRAVVGLFRDITETDWLNDDSDDLNKKMKNNIKKLTASNVELRNLINAAANDLTAHLRAITNLANWVATDYSEKFDNPGRENLDLLKKRTKKIGLVTDYLADYAHIKQNKKENKNVNLEDLLKNVIKNIKPDENIRITCEHTLPNIICEKTHIKRLFTGLLSSAVRRMPASGGYVKISCEQKNQLLKFTFADNARTTADCDSEKIFQIPRTLSPRDDLELAQLEMAPLRIIVEMYGGKIWDEPACEKENVICFTMPLQERCFQNEKLQTNIAH